MEKNRVYRIVFADLYPLYLKKLRRKAAQRKKLTKLFFWLTGYNQQTLQTQIDTRNDFETFFAQAPALNPNVFKITGVICGYRVETIEDKLIQKIRYLDKLIDELAKWKTLEKILRK